MIVNPPQKVIMDSMPKILFLEPFYGGSHKTFADQFIAHSPWPVTLETLPARFWKWRMRGAALHFSETVQNPEEYDLLITCGLLSLGDLKMLWGDRCPPAVLYLHETQLSYPLQEGEAFDYQFGFTDITSALAADRILFNSEFHLTEFFNTLPGFIKKMPDTVPKWIIEKIRRKSDVVYPGVHMSFNSHSRLDKKQPESTESEKRPPVIVWNHRWEFDKNPDAFFNALIHAENEGADFELIILGEHYRRIPKAFNRGLKALESKIIHSGYVQSREEYKSWLRKGDLVLSTAFQENYGISIIEAVLSGCRPLLPNRLSYPELVPDTYHDRILYDSNEDLNQKLLNLLQTPEKIPLPELADHFKHHQMKHNINRFFEHINEMFKHKSSIADGGITQ